MRKELLKKCWPILKYGMFIWARAATFMMCEGAWRMSPFSI